MILIQTAQHQQGVCCRFGFRILVCRLFFGSPLKRQIACIRYIILELCTGGDLFTYITTHSKQRLCEGEAKYIMYQLLKGLKYLHDRMISHRDLKVTPRACFILLTSYCHQQPENILLFSPGPYPRIQIADFGLARPKAYQETLHVCGTISYLPPEGILALEHKHLGYVGMPADCWSAGVTLFAMLTGSHPFDFASSSQSRVSFEDIVDSQGFVQSQHATAQDERTKQRILDGQVYFHESIWGPLRDGAYPGITYCFQSSTNRVFRIND